MTMIQLSVDNMVRGTYWRCQGSCGSCGEVAGTKDKGSRLDFDKACATTLERLKIGGIILKSNVHERETNIYKR